MKIVSKRNNYRIVLRSGISSEPQTGRAAVPGIYIKCNNGEAIINEDMARRMGLTIEELITMIRRHRGYGKDGDFIFVDDEELKEQVVDYQSGVIRRSIEPEHDVFQLGGKNLNPTPRMQLTADQQKILTQMAVDMAKKMAPQMAAEMLKTMVEQREEERNIPKSDIKEKNEYSTSSTYQMLKSEDTIASTDQYVLKNEEDEGSGIISVPQIEDVPQEEKINVKKRGRPLQRGRPRKIDHLDRAEDI